MVWADIDEEELVLGFVDDGPGNRGKPSDLDAGERTEEDAVLHVFAVVLEQFEEFGAGLVLHHVVGAKVSSAAIG